MYHTSFGIDTTEFSKIKLAPKFGSAVLDDADGDWTKPVRFDGKFWAGKNAKIFYSTDGTTWAEAYTAAHTVTDLEVFQNKLFAATNNTGGSGLSYHVAGTAVGSWTVNNDSGVCSYLKTWGDNLYITANNLFKSFDGSAFTTIKDFTGSTDAIYLFKKPKVFASVFYIPSNVDSNSGPSKLWHYDLENLFEIAESENPMGSEIVEYNNRLVYVVIGSKFIDFWAWNGSSRSLLFFLDQPTNAYTDVSFAETNSKLYVALTQSGTPDKYLLVYDSSGWSFQSALPSTAAISWKLGVYNKILFALGGNGNIYQLSATQYDATGELICSYFDVNLLDLTKILVNFVANLESLPASTTVKIYYRKDAEDSWTLLTTANTTGDYKVEKTFPLSTSTVKGTKIQVKIRLETSVATSTPKVKDVSLGYIVQPSSRRMFSYVIVATRQMRLLDGSVESRSPEQMLNDLWTSKASGNLLELVNKYGTFNVLFSESTPLINDPHPGESDQESLVEVAFYAIN
jgi:hypothetical protein